MQKKNALNTLLELAKRQVDEHAARLAKMLRHEMSMQEKLDLLSNYRQEYVIRLQSKMQNGLSMLHYENFSKFLVTLDFAIDEQRVLMKKDREKIVVQQQLQLNSKRKEMSFSQLIARRIRVEQHLILKNEQKLSDQFAAQLHRQKLKHSLYRYDSE